MTDERPILDQLNLVVSNMDATLEFYRELGVDVAPIPSPWHQHHRTLSTPDGFDFDVDSAEFARTWNRGWPAGATGPVIGFRVASRETVDSTYERLTSAGYVGQQPPYDAFWGARYAVISDPDGNAVGLMSPVDATRTSPPPPPPSST